MCLEIIYLIYMYKKDLALNNLQCLISDKTKPSILALERLNCINIHIFRFNGTMRCCIVTYADSHLHTCTYICRIIHSDTTIKTQEGKRRKTSLTTYIPLTLLQGFKKVVQGLSCERVLETEHKLHILTPLL